MVLALLAAADEVTSDGSSYFFAYMGVASALVFANLGSAYGIAKSGVGIASLGVIEPNKVFRGLIPIIMAGILGIYGIIVAALLSGDSANAKEPKDGYRILGAVSAVVSLPSLQD